MNWLERWFLRRLAAKLVRQGWHHDANIREYYQILAEAARKEFTEDTGVALNQFLTEKHQEARV